jgi:hypothetical protein
LTKSTQSQRSGPEKPSNSESRGREIITTAMVEAMAALFPEVPVEVEANVCTTWAEK